MKPAAAQQLRRPSGGFREAAVPHNQDIALLGSRSPAPPGPQQSGEIPPDKPQLCVKVEAQFLDLLRELRKHSRCGSANNERIQVPLKREAGVPKRAIGVTIGHCWTGCQWKGQQPWQRPPGQQLALVGCLLLSTGFTFSGALFAL